MMKPNLPLLAFFLVFPLIFSGQSRWERTYFDGWNASICDIEESYDRGYILASNFTSRSGYHTKLLKTDINGEPLWEKVIKFDSGGLAAFHSMMRNKEGELFLAGTYQYYDHDPIIIKLNTCGEKLWCTRITTNITNDYALKICPLTDGGCAVSICNGGSAWNKDRVCILRLDSEGNYIWQHCYNAMDTNVWNLEHEDLIQTPDKGYLITGHCDYSDTTPIVHSNVLPYLIKTDSLGVMQWEFILEKDSADNHGYAHSSLVSPDGLYYYTSLSRGVYGQEQEGWLPALLKTDIYGNHVTTIELKPPGEHSAGVLDFLFLNDSTIAAIATWNEGDEVVKKLILIDTAGNILREKEFFERSLHDLLIKDEENKLLLFTLKYLSDINVDLYLLKYNHHLIDDTLYLQPVSYDSLCPYTILHDTIFLDDCGLFVNLDERQDAEIIHKGQVQEFPNPCSDYVSFIFLEEDKPTNLEIYSIYGKLVLSRDLSFQENELRVNTSFFPPGIIFAVFRYPGGRIETLKIIKI